MSQSSSLHALVTCASALQPQRACQRQFLTDFAHAVAIHVSACSALDVDSAILVHLDDDIDVICDAATQAARGHWRLDPSADTCALLASESFKE